MKNLNCVVYLLALTTLIACGVAQDAPVAHGYGTFCGTGASDSGAGGSAGTGGTPATGGAQSTGGAASGGTPGTGGASTGGVAGTGGASTGGSAGTGGTCVSVYPSFVQVGSQDQQGSFRTVSAAMPGAQAAGNLNVVGINWYAHQSVTVSTVTDTRGNAYAKAIGPVRSASFTEYIYYAPHIAAGSNTVTVTLSAPAEYVDVRVSEYAGFTSTVTVDSARSAIGTGVTSTVSGVVTTTPRELIYYAGATANSFTSMVSPAFLRLIAPHDADVTGDRIAVDVGTYSIAGQNNVTSEWVAEAVAFAGNAKGCAPTATYSTDFNLTESVISENGAWQSGIDALQSPVATGSGLAFGTQTGNEHMSGNYNDSSAYLSGFSSSQRGSGVIHKANSGISNAYQEVEILLRWSVGALRTGLPYGDTHSYGYEVNLAWNAQYIQIGRFKDAGLFDSLSTGSPITTLGVQDGDVFAAEIFGNTITATLTRSGASTVIAQGTDTTTSPFTTGNPGVGFYRDNNNGAGTTTPTSFAFTHFDAQSP